jgi:tRNA pseudouridine55 synthase
MDGIINLNKPRGITSAKALYRVRKITGVRKSGYAGTLDPAADGVLVLCLGKATKLVESLMDQPKVYRATARLDVTSASFDADEPLEPVAIERQPDADKVRAALASFEGLIEQTPPAFSAIKIGGQPAYRLARRGKPPTLKSRPVSIYWLVLHRYAWPEVEFEMACGRGTYVRSLIRDLGIRLGAGGCLTQLTRRAVGPFHIADAFSPDALGELPDPSTALVPLAATKALLEAPGVAPTRP